MHKNESALGQADWRQRLGEAYLAACETDITAFKPGNVSVYSEGHEMTVADFRRSAAVSEPFLTDIRLSLGEKIYYAVDATQEAVGCNTNLGIILLCAPMLQAVQIPMLSVDFRNQLQNVLENTTREDAQWVYQAIRSASPGGLGKSKIEDVSQRPQVTLTDAMGIASDKDRIAWQYVNSYKDVLDFGIKRYHIAFRRWGDVNWAAVAIYVGLLRRIPDSHIVRKYGNRFTGIVNTRMTILDEELSKTDYPEDLIKHLRHVDAEFKSFGINPGSTADLTVASLLAVDLVQMLGKENQMRLKQSGESNSGKP